MKSSEQTAAADRQVLSGTLWNMVAEGSRLPVGFITVFVLTRVLGPENFGRFTLTTTVVLWLKFSISILFEQATLKLVGEAEDWRPIATKVSQLTGVLSLGVMLLLWGSAPAIATLLQDPALANYLRLFSLDIPLFCFARLHINLLTGIGQFRSRALGLAGYWLTRGLLIVGLVFLGWSVPGALIGCLSGSLASLLIGRTFIQPSLFQKARAFPTRQLWMYAAPLFISGVSMQVYLRLDLFAYKVLSGTVAQAGVYALAINLTLIAQLFALALNPLLLATLSRLLKAQDHKRAQTIAQTALRILLLQLPLLAMLVASASELIVLGFGTDYAAAAPLFTWLLFSALGLDLVQMTAAILAGIGRPRASLGLTAPLPLIALCGYVWLIPSLGAVGAAQVKTLVILLGGLVGGLMVRSAWAIRLPIATLCRSVLLCGVSYTAALFWITPGWWVLLKLVIVSIGIVLGLALLGEFDQQDIALIRSKLPFKA